QYSTLRSALAVPLEGSADVAAVLALYRARADAFTRDDLQVLETIASSLGALIEQSTARKAAGTAAGAD
ncbi:MAG: GAF domain-containing protein, partial [Candidatus Sulfotelmatobacter sp.]